MKRYTRKLIGFRLHIFDQEIVDSLNENYKEYRVAYVGRDEDNDIQILLEKELLRGEERFNEQPASCRKK